MEKVKEKEEQKAKEMVLQLETGEEINLKQLISEATVEGMKEAGLPFDESGKFSMRALPVEVQDEVSRKQKDYEASANFIKSLILPVNLHKEYGVKAIDTSSGSFGTVVPTELYNEIVAQTLRWQVVRKYAFVFSLTGKIDVPTQGTGVTGFWVSENAPVTESNPTSGKISLDDNGVAALIKVSWKLLRTSPQNITKFVSTLAARAITDKEESAFIDGDGAGKPLGLRQTAGIGSIAQAGANLTYDDLMALFFSLPATYRRSAQFVTSSKGARLIHALKDSQNRPIFQPNMQLDQLMGKPLLESQDMPANLGVGLNETEVFFGDLFNYWIKDGSQLEMATQDQIENLQTKIVIYKYVDGKLTFPAAFQKLTAVK